MACVSGGFWQSRSHIVFSHISHHLETHKVLCEEQHGFRPNRSCETQLISTINDFSECLNQGGQCDVLLLDFSKAFDKVPHTHLCNKLHHYGIHGALLFWLQAFLHNRSQYVMDLIHYSFAPLILFLVPYTLDLLP